MNLTNYNEGMLQRFLIVLVNDKTSVLIFPVENVCLLTNSPKNRDLIFIFCTTSWYNCCTSSTTSTEMLSEFTVMSPISIVYVFLVRLITEWINGWYKINTKYGSYHQVPYWNHHSYWIWSTGNMKMHKLINMDMIRYYSQYQDHDCKTNPGFVKLLTDAYFCYTRNIVQNDQMSSSFQYFA